MSSVVSYLQSLQTEPSKITSWEIIFFTIHKWWISNVLLSDCFFSFCKVFVLVSNNKIGNYKYHFWHNLDQFDRISWQNTVIFKYHLSDCFWKYHDRIVVKTREKYTAFFHYSSCLTATWLWPSPLVYKTWSLIFLNVTFFIFTRSIALHCIGWC